MMHLFFEWFGCSGKGVLSCLMSLTALALFLVSPDRTRLLCLLAMLLSTLGDFSMSKLLPAKCFRRLPSPAMGALFFMVAHVFYIFAYLQKSRIQSVRFSGRGTLFGALLAAFALLSLLLFFRQQGGGNGFDRAGALVYALVISCNCTVVITYALHRGGMHTLAAVGALCFFVSDYIIAARQFTGASCLRGLFGEQLIWWFYPVGQLLLQLFI